MDRLLRKRLNGVDFRDGKPHKEVPEALYTEPYITLRDRQALADMAE